MAGWLDELMNKQMNELIHDIKTFLGPSDLAKVTGLARAGLRLILSQSPSVTLPNSYTAGYLEPNIVTWPCGQK